MRTHKELVVWQKSMEMVKCLYLVTQAFPKEEIYGITSQMRRAAYRFRQILQKDSAEGMIKS